MSKTNKIKILFILALMIFAISPVQGANYKEKVKEGFKSHFQIENAIPEAEVKQDFINNVFLVELDKVCKPHLDTYEADNKKIHTLYEKFQKNKNNMYDNRVLYEMAKDFSDDNLKILDNQLENLYKAHNHYHYTSKYGRYSYDLYFDNDELKLYGIAKISEIKNMYKEWQDIADEVWQYSYDYENKKKINYYKNKYGATFGGDMDTLLLSPSASPKVGEYYSTSTYLNVMQAINGGVLVKSGMAQAYGYQPHFKNAYIVTNKTYVTGQNITGRFQYIGTYSYTTTLGARNTVWKFKEIAPPPDTFYFVYK